MREQREAPQRVAAGCETCYPNKVVGDSPLPCRTHCRGLLFLARQVILGKPMSEVCRNSPTGVSEDAC